MKYVVLIYSNPATWAEMPAAERDRAMGVHFKLINELTESGELLRVDGLTDPMATKTIRARGGVPVVTDGPFGEAKEFLAGVWAIDVESLERAIEIAAPVAEYDTVEVRALMDLSGLEM
ncbi:MAG TPA: YciI family protein [Verrucomicrobiae bacterium]|nr:YciI family protein [Verrucomicrobiae bacterium]